MSKQTKPFYLFGSFHLDPNERVLRRDGKPVSLTQKVFDLLLVLVENSGHIVEKEELLEKVWPDTIVEEGNINRNISTLRKVLGEESGEPTYIETIPRRGYRFIAPVKEERQLLTKQLIEEPENSLKTTPQEATASPERDSAVVQRIFSGADEIFAAASWKAVLIVVGVCALTVPFITAMYYLRSSRPNTTGTGSPFKSVAVLPFKLIGEDSSNDYLRLGIADALITKLSNLRQLSVRPTSAIRKYTTASLDPAGAGRELHVESVLEGSIQKQDGQIRVTVQLINVQDGLPMWADKFDEKYTNLFMVQDSIAEKVTKALQLQLTATERERVYRRYTENLAAYDLYLQGRSHLVNHTLEDEREAVKAFEKALEIEPTYALAHAGLAMASAMIRTRFASEAEIATWEKRAKQEAYTALELHPELAEAHEALGTVYRYTDFDWDHTIEESSLALELNPNLDLPHYHRAVAFYHLGLLEFVEDEVRAGLEIDPLNRLEPLRLRGMAAFYSGRFAEAVALLEESRQVNPGGVAGRQWHLAQAYFYQKERGRSEAELTQLCSSGLAEERARAQASLASFLAARGEKNRATTLLNSLLSATYMDHHVAYSVGAAYAQIGDHGQALKWLVRATETGLPCYPWYERDPLLDPLRKDLEFQQFLRRQRESWEAAKVRYKNHVESSGRLK